MIPIHKFALSLALLGGVLTLHEGAAAQTPRDGFGTASCMGCHGQAAMGGLGPPIAKTKLSLDEFEQIVRSGKGMMPATAEAQLSKDDLAEIYKELQAKPWRPDQIPIAFKVGQLLSIRNLSFYFMGVFGFAFIFGMRVLWTWLRNAGLVELWPHLRKAGLLRSAGIALRSLVVDGLCVASLWRTNRFRWLMHGLILYGFLGLMAADMLMQVFNPSRGDLPFTNPLKLLPVAAGVSVFTGICYAMYRYRKDAYVDNGLTLGRDFLFLNLLFHTIVSGFLTVAINRSTAHGWVMPLYLYHLASISLLIATAPFTRFAHAWVVPSLVAVTRLTEMVTAAGVNLGFSREPMPGRHHKSEKIARQVLSALGPDYEGEFRLRYYP